MRKHPEVLALTVIGFALFASIGLDGALRRAEQERLRIQPLIHKAERIDVENLVESTVSAVVREVLRDVLH